MANEIVTITSLIATSLKAFGFTLTHVAIFALATLIYGVLCRALIPSNPYWANERQKLADRRDPMPSWDEWFLLCDGWWCLVAIALYFHIMFFCFNTDWSSPKLVAGSALVSVHNFIVLSSIMVGLNVVKALTVLIHGLEVPTGHGIPEICKRYYRAARVALEAGRRELDKTPLPQTRDKQ